MCFERKFTKKITCSFYLMQAIKNDLIKFAKIISFSLNFKKQTERF